MLLNTQFRWTMDQKRQRQPVIDAQKRRSRSDLSIRCRGGGKPTVARAGTDQAREESQHQAHRAAGQAGPRGAGPGPPGMRGHRPPSQSLRPTGASQLRGPVSRLPLTPTNLLPFLQPQSYCLSVKRGSFPKSHACFNMIGENLKRSHQPRRPTRGTWMELF